MLGCSGSSLLACRRESGGGVKSGLARCAGIERLGGNYGVKSRKGIYLQDHERGLVAALPAELVSIEWKLKI